MAKTEESLNPLMVKLRLSRVNSEFYQYFLERSDGLVSNRNPVDFTNLIANVESGLAVDHASMHDPRHNALTVFVHFERDALKSIKLTF